MSDNPRLDAAHGYARRGWRVIPLHHMTGGTCSCKAHADCRTPAKHPVHTEWQHAGTTSGADIEEWWAARPNAGVGIVTGLESGVWALDVDADKGGVPSIFDLIDEHGPLPATRIHATGSGGVHYLFTCPGDFPIPNTAGSLGAGIDTRGADGMIVAPPSVSSRGSYSVVVDIDPAPAPNWLLDRLREVAAARAKNRETAIVSGVTLDIDTLPSRLRDRLSIVSVPDRSAHFHGTVAACRRAGLTQGQTVTALDYWCGHVGKYIGRVATEVARSWGKLTDADPAHDPDRYVEELDSRPFDPAPADHDDPVQADLAALIALTRRYQDLPDPGHLYATLAVAATRDHDDDPVWLLLVAPPSSGKSESIGILKSCADAHLDDVTAAGLLSWKAGKKPAPTGALTRVGGKALLTFGDLSTLLAQSNTGAKDHTFGVLRKLYDGHVVRDLGNAPEQLEWKGKATVVGAVTGIIDNYASHADALGPRWIYYRMPARSTSGKRRASRLARSGGIAQLRGEASALAARIIYAARQRVDDDVPDRVADAIDDAALVTCWGRAAVPRHGYGKREIDGTAVIEEPPRLIRQLRGLARGLLALGCGEDQTQALCRKVALDSMPEQRNRVIRVLTEHDEASTNRVATLAELNWHVAYRTLEELAAVGVVGTTESEDDEQGDGRGGDRRNAATVWWLKGDEGKIIRSVFGLHEFIIATPRPPQTETSEQDQQENSGGGSCVFVRTDDAGQTDGVS